MKVCKAADGIPLQYWIKYRPNEKIPGCLFTFDLVTFNKTKMLITDYQNNEKETPAITWLKNRPDEELPRFLINKKWSDELKASFIANYIRYKSPNLPEYVMEMFTSLSTRYKINVVAEAIFHIEQSDDIINHILYQDGMKAEDADLL